MALPNINNSGAISIPPISGGGGSGKKLRLSIEAKENIPAFVVVTIDGYRANSGTTAHAGKVAGVAIVGANTGFMLNVTPEGEIENSAWSFSPGDVIFLNGINLSTVPANSGFRILIGKALLANKIYVNVSDSIIL